MKASVDMVRNRAACRVSVGDIQTLPLVLQHFPHEVQSKGIDDNDDHHLFFGKGACKARAYASSFDADVSTLSS